MFRSIRWTLQLWHAGILAVALASFGTALYFTVAREQAGRVDAELQQAAQGLAAIPPGPPSAPPRPRADGSGPPQGFPPQDDWRPEPPLRNPPEVGGGPPGPGFPTRGAPEWGLHIPPDALRRVGDGERPYFVIWRADGAVVRQSANAPDVPAARPVDVRLPPPGPRRPAAPAFRTRGMLREVILPVPGGGQLLVGRSLDAEAASLASLRWSLAGIGAAILAVGLCGGWVLATRAIRPIRAISQTAAGISASDLSRRIAVEETKSELGALAGTLNEAFARLEAAFARQARFTADASHELRTPLAVVHSHAELALSRERTAEEYKLALEACLRGAQRMRALVESLLVLARADAGKLQLQCAEFDLREAVEEGVAMIGPQAKARGVAVETDLASVAVHADRMRMLQVITNLLVNAVQYNREGGRIVVTLVEHDGAAMLSVADTGIGMAPEDQAHVFERFFRADKARSREAGGSGLGLAICQGIVDAHGGRIEFTSRLGEGSTFTVRLRRR